jgi:hypothetical protein
MSGQRLAPISPDRSLEQIFAALAERFAAGFAVERPALRTVGREAEFPVVDTNGETVDVRRLWQTLLANPQLEPEWGPDPNATLSQASKGPIIPTRWRSGWAPSR